MKPEVQQGHAEDLDFHIPITEKFHKSVCMRARVGLYFHAPIDYPLGELGGWKHVCWLPVEAVWQWILRVAPDVEYNNYGVSSVVNLRGTTDREAPTFAELRAEDPLQLFYPGVAVVVQVTEKEILALYHDPEPPADEPFPFSLMRMRP